MSSIQQSDNVFRRVCPICEARCGVLVTVDPATSKVTAVRGDPDDLAARGYICPKGVAVKNLQEDPDVIRTPLIKRNGVFEEASWEEALDYAGTRLNELRSKYGADSVGTFVGNGFATSPGMLLYLGLFMMSLGSKQSYSSSSVDHLSRLVATLFLYGSSESMPVPDIDRTTFFVAHGANPVVSNGSFMTAPGMPDRLRDLRKRGGKLVVIDPRYTETARVADLHIAIRPGTDAAFMLACINHLFATDQVRLGRAEGIVKGLDSLRELAREFTPERVEALTGVPPATLRAFMDEFVRADGAAWYGRTGLCTQYFGTLSSWLQEVMNIVTGNLDRSGGVMFAGGAIPGLAYRENMQFGPAPFGRWHTRISGMPEFCGSFPSAALPEEILEPGEGQIRGFVTIGANPVLTTPNGPKLDEALKSLDFMVSLDIYINETTRHADVILPNASQYTESSFYLLHIAFMVRRWVKWTPPILPSKPGQRHAWEILRALAARFADQPEEVVEEQYVDMWLRTFLDGGDNPLNGQVDFDEARRLAGTTAGPDRLFDILLRTGRFGDAFGHNKDGLTLERLAQHPEGMDFGPMEPQLPGALKTPDGQIDLVPEVIAADMARLMQSLENPREGLLLIGRRHARSKNSWMHNLDMLARGKDRCTVMIHPHDAQPLDIEDGDAVTVSTQWGALQINAEVTEEIMPGVISIPHGWGHGQRGTRMGVANDHPGVNVNAIISEKEYDAASIISVVNGISVCIEKVVEGDPAMT